MADNNDPANPAFAAAVDAVAEMLLTNRQGAYGIAVRHANTQALNADKIMEAALAHNKKGLGKRKGTMALVDVEFPTKEQLEAELLEQAEAAGGLGPDTLVLVPLLVLMMVAERKRILTMLGKA